MSQLFVDTIRNRDGNGAPVFDKGIVISGIITASGSLGGESVSIGVTEVISSEFQLKNIQSLDATTTAAVESAVAAAPNDFTSLSISGISTFGDDVDLNADIDILGHTAANTVAAAGILTALLLSTGAESSAIRISSNTISGPAILTIDPAGIGTNTGKVVIQGDFQVDGNTTTVNSTTLTVDDKNIILASGSLTDVSSDGGGITLESGEGNKTINWFDSTDSWTFSENLDLASSKTYKINGVDILSATTLGSSVLNSSLTSVGTLTSLNVSGDLDVDGHTNLDNVNVSGAITATTFTGNLDGTVNTAAQPNVTSVGTLTGLTVSGDIDVDGHTNLDNASIAGVSTFEGSFVRMAPGGGNSGILKFGTGNEYQILAGSNKLELFAGTSRRIELNHGNSVYLKTSDTGVDITGGLTASGISTFAGAVDANGDLDVDGHTNLDNVSIAGVATVGLTTVLETGILTHDLNVSGVSTFNGDIRLTEQDGAGIYFGAGLDFAIAHDGSNSYVFDRGGTGNVYLAGSNEVIIADASGSGPNPSDYVTETKARFVTNGPVRLYYDNVEKFATAGTGATVYGTLTVSGLENSGSSTFTGDLDVDGHTNLDNVNVSGAITATTFTGNLDGDVTGTLLTVGQPNITSLGTLIGLNVSGDLDVDGHTNLDNVSISGFTTISQTLIVNGNVDIGPGDLDVDGHTNLDNVSIAGVTTFASSIDADGNLDVDGTTELDILNVSETATFSANIDANASLDVAGNINALTFRAGLSTFTGFVYDEVSSDLGLRNGSSFNNNTGVAFTGGGTDTLYWDFATASSVIGGEADNGISVIELANLPTNRSYHTRATLITWTDSSNDWDTGNVVLKVNGQTPTNYLWRNGAQPVGTTTGAANHFDIVEFKIVHDTNNEFSVFAEWSAYHAST